MPMSNTVQYPTHDGLLVLSFISVNLPHLLFLDKVKSWSDPYDGYGAYGQIDNYEAQRVTENGKVRVVATRRPESARPADPSRETGGATSTWVGTRESDGARVLVVRDPVGCARDYARYLELVIDGMVPVADAFDLDMGVAVVYADPPRHRLAEVVDELGDLPRGQVLGILRHVCAVVGAMTSAGLPAPQLTVEHIGVGPDGSIWLCESAIGSAPDGATGRDLASAAAVSAREADVPTRDARGELESSAIAGLLSLAADLLPPDALAALGLDDVGAEWSGLGALIATLDQAHRALVCLEQVPLAVDGNAGERFLLDEHVSHRVAHLGQLGRGEIGFAPHRRKPRRRQQRIVLAQRYVERRGEPHHHVAAWCGATELEKAEMTLRNVGAAGEIELRASAALAPRLQLCREALPLLHDYLPSS